MDPHRIHYDLYRGPKVLDDPGDGGTIRVVADLSICEMVSAAVETRILASPTKPGLRLILRMITDGGAITLTAANGLTVSLSTYAVFDDAGDFLSLISVTKTAGSPPSAAVYRWQVLDGNIGVSLA